MIHALNASGLGEGYVPCVCQRQNPDFTPVGDPVSQIIKVVPELYNGELQVRLSSNPLDEQVSLRYSGDFAAQPEHYEFTGAGHRRLQRQPTATYTLSNQSYLGNAANDASRHWLIQQSDPALPAATTYPTSSTTLPATLASCKRL